MKLENIKERIEEKIIRRLFKKQSEKNNFSLDLIEKLYYQKKYNLLKIFYKANTNEKLREQIIEYIKENPYDDICYIIISGLITNQFNDIFTYLEKEQMNLLIENNYNKEEIDQIMEKLEPILYDYICNNNRVKNQILYNKEKNIDMTISYTKEMLRDTLNNMRKPINCETMKMHEIKPIEELQKLITKIFSSYKKEDLLNDIGFIKFELENHTFDKIMSNYTKEKIDYNERKEIYNKNKELTIKQQEDIYNIKLLKERLLSLNNEQANNLLENLEKVEENPEENIDLLKEIYLDYEVLFRTNLTNRLYTPKEDIVIDDYTKIKPMLLHKFLRSSDVLLKRGLEKIESDIIAKRPKEKQDITKYPLSEQEKSDYEKRKKYLIDVLLNQTIVEKAYNTTGGYHDSSGLMSYISNTSNQISASLYNLDEILECREECYGIGFDQSLPPENIIISSSQYQTTNRGLNNIISDNEFEDFSSPLVGDNKTTTDSEIVMTRNGEFEDTKAAYFFCMAASISSPIVEKAREIAETNHLKLVILDLMKIKESYQAVQNLLPDNNQSLHEDLSKRI